MSYILSLENAFEGISFVEQFSSRKDAEKRAEELCEKNHLKYTRSGSKFLIKENFFARITLAIYEMDKLEYYVVTSIIDKEKDARGALTSLLESGAVNYDMNVYYPFPSAKDAEKFIVRYISDNKDADSEIIERYGAYYYWCYKGQMDCSSYGIAAKFGSSRYVEYNLDEALKLYRKSLNDDSHKVAKDEPKNTVKAILVHVAAFLLLFLLALVTKNNYFLWNILIVFVLLSMIIWLSVFLSLLLKQEYCTIGSSDSILKNSFDSYTYDDEYENWDGTKKVIKKTICPWVISFSDSQMKMWRDPSEYKKPHVRKMSAKDS